MKINSNYNKPVYKNRSEEGYSNMTTALRNLPTLSVWVATGKRSKIKLNKIYSRNTMCQQSLLILASSPWNAKSSLSLLQ